MQIGAVKEVVGPEADTDTAEHGGRNDVEFHTFGRVADIETAAGFGGVDEGEPGSLDVFAVECGVVVIACTFKLGHIKHIIKSDIVALTAVNGAPVGNERAGVVQNVGDQRNFSSREIFAAGIVIKFDDLAMLFNTEFKPGAAVT